MTMLNRNSIKKLDFTELFNLYGKKILFSILVILASLSSLNYYKRYKEIQAFKASEIYINLINALSKSDYQSSKTLSQTLQNEYAKTPYAELASWIMAKLALDKDDLVLAINTLQSAAHKTPKGRIDAQYNINQVRLARLLIAHNQDAEALKILEKGLDGSYATLYQETLGDYYLKIKDYEKAKQAYKQALKASPKGNKIPWIEMKLADVGGAGE
ncbi:MAG: uncharacterized protein JWM09_729 [Francisellaceae bacterium]|nr:uncharacterized protein [Francisellaceae bacterium]